MVSIERALTIPDLRWPWPSELKWLAEQAAKHRRIVELGSYLGRSTVAMAENTTGEILALDDWKGPRDVGLSDEEREGLYEQFMRNTDSWWWRVFPVRCDHANPPRGLKPDMVFIDGSHEYADVVRDIKFWQAEIEPGGLLCGHDAEWEPVQRALLDVYGTNSIGAIKGVGVVEGTNIWLQL